jgi:polysaccharide pyruvyl transferase WcaK-like protein
MNLSQRIGPPHHIRCFFDVGEWLDYASTVDLTLGSRLHGAIAALIAGRPALLVTHDSRTKEMAIQAGIPSIDKSEILIHKEPDFAELHARIDPSEFNERQLRYYKNFIDFFEVNKVAHNLVAESVKKTEKVI